MNREFIRKSTENEEMESEWGNPQRMRKWKENEEMEREEMEIKWGNWEEMERECLFPHSLSISSQFPHFLSISSFSLHFLSISSFSLHFLFISSFSLHFLFISSFSLHFLAARLQGCNDFCSPAQHQGHSLTHCNWLASILLYKYRILKHQKL